MLDGRFRPERDRRVDDGRRQTYGKKRSKHMGQKILTVEHLGTSDWPTGSTVWPLQYTRGHRPNAPSVYLLSIACIPRAVRMNRA